MKDDRQVAANAAWLSTSERLVAGLHHALNNRLAAIRGVAQVLDTELPTGHPLKGALQGEIDRTEPMVRLLHGMGEVEWGFIPFQAEEIIQDTKDLVAIHHELRDFTFESSLEGELLPVVGNPDMSLRTLVMMVEALPRTTDRVKLQIVAVEKWVRFEVTGIDAEGTAQPPREVEGLSDVAESAGAADAKRVADGILELYTLPEWRRMEEEEEEEGED